MPDIIRVLIWIQGGFLGAVFEPPCTRKIITTTVVYNPFETCLSVTISSNIKQHRSREKFHHCVSNAHEHFQRATQMTFKVSQTSLSWNEWQKDWILPPSFFKRNAHQNTSIVSSTYFQLRYLQTLTSISAEKNSTIIFPLPIDTIGNFLVPMKHN